MGARAAAPRRRLPARCSTAERLLAGGACRIARKPPRTIAVALHDIEPATFERCALIRDWLSDHGVDRVTLLVIPARDLHPLGERSPEMTSWLAERRSAGDSIAQHGFQHERTRRQGLSPQALLRSPARRAGEFVGLDIDETQRAVNAGWRVLKLAGIEPDGFVAPAYAYTPALRSVLPRRFRWWAGLLGVHRRAHAAEQERGRLLAPAWGMGTDRPARARLLAGAATRRRPAVRQHAAARPAPGRPAAPAPHDRARPRARARREPAQSDHLRRARHSRRLSRRLTCRAAPLPGTATVRASRRARRPRSRGASRRRSPRTCAAARNG